MTLPTNITSIINEPFSKVRQMNITDFQCTILTVAWHAWEDIQNDLENTRIAGFHR